LGGRRPAVLMQNSGLGTSLNALASLSVMYGLPALLLVTWRGWRGEDAPEHLLMGEISPRLLELLGIPHRVLTPTALTSDVGWARDEMDAQRRPVALLVPPGIFSGDSHGSRTARERGGLEGAVSAPSSNKSNTRAVLQPYAEGAKPLVAKISRMRAIAAAIKELGDEPVVHANGYPSRESCAVADRPQNFYMIGSMGLAAPIGLGLALARPRGPVVVFDGDGNLLMALGVLANVAALAPANFVHCVFDNQTYGSTGNQRSVSGRVRLDALAAAAGYRRVAAVADAEALGQTLRDMLGAEGPHFLLVKVTDEEAKVPRIPHSPEAIRDRFRTSVLRA
ncbi:MAG: thiamine pyrophosphate-dependent enzyme, partial [Candidatus Rokuibacteriota bacterium]